MERYSSMKLEMLGMKWAITEKFRDYLLGSNFVVFTDNNPLAHLKSAKLGAVEQRWVGALSVFDFEVKYKPGAANKAADGLSRRPHPTNEEPHASEACCQTVGVTRLPNCLKHTHAHVNATQCETARKDGKEGDTCGTPAPFPKYTREQLNTFQQRDPAIR